MAEAGATEAARAAIGAVTRAAMAAAPRAADTIIEYGWARPQADDGRALLKLGFRAALC
jgi:hypothetical protein